MYMLRTDGWYLERAVFLVAGIVVTASVLLSVTASPWWVLLAAFAGMNLVVFSATGFCLMANILKKAAGLKPRLGR
jgi:uncharacterized membrane protein